MIRGILNFMQVNTGFGFDVPAREAIKYFKAKGLRESFSYADVFREEHVNAFTVAKMLDMDLLKDVQDSIYSALTEGLSYEEWSDRLIPTLQANGWWGRQAMVDPLTGKTVIAELGSSRRLQIIFRTNMQSAYSVGRWQQIMAQAADAPYLMYDAVDDYRTRPQHRAWDNLVLAITDVFWKRHYPPNGWGCRCGVIQLSQDDLDAMGLSVSDSPKTKYVDWKNPRTGKVERIPEGIDAGFDFNAGQARYNQLQEIARQKAADMPAELKSTSQRGLGKANIEAKKPVNLNDSDHISVAEQRRIIDQWVNEPGLRESLLSDPDIVATAAHYGLTIEEQIAMRYYTSTGHGVNSYLLESMPYNKKKYDIEQAGADLLNQALSKLPNFDGVVVSRMSLPNHIVEKMQEGSELLFPAFTSADDEADVFPSRKHRLIIKSRTAKKIRWISEHKDTESEVLFSSPTWFKVVGVEQKSDGEIWFKLDEVVE